MSRIQSQISKQINLIVNGSDAFSTQAGHFSDFSHFVMVINQLIREGKQLFWYGGRVHPILFQEKKLVFEVRTAEFHIQLELRIIFVGLLLSSHTVDHTHMHLKGLKWEKMINTISY